MNIRSTRLRIVVASITAVAVAAGLWFAGRAILAPARRTLRVAYIARYTNLNDSIPTARQTKGTFAVLHEIVLRDYLTRLGAGFPGIDFELVPLDNRSDAATTDSLYRTVIAPDTTIIATIDNGWGVDIARSAATIRAHDLPVISINADRNNGDFGRSTVFTGNDDDVPHNIVAYIHRTFGTDSVVFITETDYSLDTVFHREFAANGMTIAREFGIAAKAHGAHAAELFEGIDAWHRSHPEERRLPIVINTHNKLGDGILEHLDGLGDSLTIVGGKYISSLAALQAFGRGRRNRLIVMSRPNDALSRGLQVDIERFRAGDPVTFASPSAPHFVKRCADAVEILRTVLSARDSLAPGRRRMQAGLEHLRGEKVAGDDDVYEFDSNLVTAKDVDFTMYRNREFYSMPAQLNRRGELIPNIFFGVDILDMYDIDVNTNTFRADFFYWVKLDTAYRSAERNIIFQNIRQTESSRELVIEKLDGPTLYRLYKVSAQFHNDYILRDFPLDAQEIAIRVEILDPSERLKISFDQRSIEADSNVVERFSVRAWNKLGYYVTVDNRISSSMRGDPENREGDVTVFKSISFRLHVKRKFVGPFLEIILPLVLIGFVAIALLYVRDISFENLGEVSVGTFLGIITFSIALSNISPSSDYLTRADLLFWLTFMVVLVSFMTVIIVNSRFEMAELERVNIRPIAWVVTLAYPIAAIAILML